MGAIVTLLPAESRPETPGNHGPLSLEGGVRGVFYCLCILPLSPFSTFGMYYFVMRKNYKHFF